jgi:hypothetical protein
LRRTTAAAFAEAAHRYSVFYQPTGDGRATARAGRVARAVRLDNFLPIIRNGSGPFGRPEVHGL